MLRKAGANKLADRIAAHGYDNKILDNVEKAMNEARERTFPGTEMVEPSIAWYNRWKELHPHFNTVDY